MSDTSFASVNQKNKFIEIIDDDWLQDCLSDDEIEVPKDFEFGAEDDIDDEEQQMNEDVWNDTGLGMFVEESDLQR